MHAIATVIGILTLVTSSLTPNNANIAKFCHLSRILKTFILSIVKSKFIPSNQSSRIKARITRLKHLQKNPKITHSCTNLKMFPFLVHCQIWVRTTIQPWTTIDIKEKHVTGFYERWHYHLHIFNTTQRKFSYFSPNAEPELIWLTIQSK